MKKFQELILKISAEQTNIFLKSFFFTMIISSAYAALVEVLISEKLQTSLYIRTGWIIIYGLFAILIAVTLLIIKLKVTAFKKKSNRLILLHPQSGKTEIYERPEWKKVPYSIINFSHSWEEMISADKHLDISFFIEKNIYRKIGENYFSYNVHLPITISLHFNGDITIFDLETISQGGNKGKLKRRVINFEEFIKETFFNTNSDPDKMEKIYSAASEWLEGKCSQVFLTKTAERMLSFPEKLFTCVKDVKLKIGLADSRINPMLDIQAYPSLTSQNSYAYNL